MSDAFDRYTNACNRMAEAEKGANAVVDELRRTIGPLLGLTPQGFPPPWKSIYLAGIGEDIPATLLRRAGPGQPRNPLNVGNVSVALAQLQRFMGLYAEAEQEAVQAYQTIPVPEKSYVGHPPWAPH